MTYGEIVKKFLKDAPKLPYAREVKLLKPLITKYPELEFWENLDLGFKLNSLAFFNTENGEEVISSKYYSWKSYCEKRKAIFTNGQVQDTISDQTSISRPATKTNSILDSKLYASH